jgi:hypothetical protein
MTDRFEPGSYRDHRARVFDLDGSIYRAVGQEAFESWRVLSRTRFFDEFSRAGNLVVTQEVADEQRLSFGLPTQWVAVLQHERIPFVSYFYEWSFGMLKDAALLQLKLLQAALAEDMSLRDSTPFNIQWVGTNPVFIDISSFGRLSHGEPWTGYRQFCQMFLYPLFLQSYKGIPFQTWLRGNIEGLKATHLCRIFGPRDYLRPGVFVHLYLHAKAEARYAHHERDIKGELQNAGFSTRLIQSNVRRLERLVYQLSIKHATSEWLTYEDTNTYSQADREKKVAFVQRVVQSRPWNLVWDFGCNSGIYSRIAAENAQYVVAFDADAMVVDNLYQRLKSEKNSRVLPLVVDLVNPSPRLGWRGLERKNLLDRGAPDLVICLALMHHVVIGANVPLREFVDWLVSFGSDVVIEFVSKQDPMVQALFRNREENHSDYDEELFQRCFFEAFDVLWCEKLTIRPCTLYYGRARRH